VPGKLAKLKEDTVSVADTLPTSYAPTVRAPSTAAGSKVGGSSAADNIKKYKYEHVVQDTADSKKMCQDTADSEKDNDVANMQDVEDKDDLMTEHTRSSKSKKEKNRGPNRAQKRAEKLKEFVLSKGGVWQRTVLSSRSCDLCDRIRAGSK
jgi:hypothetical protein